MLAQCKELVMNCGITKISLTMSGIHLFIRVRRQDSLILPKNLQSDDAIRYFYSTRGDTEILNASSLF